MVCDIDEINKPENFVWYEDTGTTLMDLGEVSDADRDISDWPTPHDTTREFLEDHGIYQEAQKLAERYS